jgi:hypothetical protein
MFLFPRAHVNFAAHMQSDLNHDMGGRPEPIDRQASTATQAAALQTAVSNNACAQQRRGLLVGKDIRDRICEFLIYDSKFRVPAVLMIAGKTRAFAQVLLTSPAENAFPARMAQPCYANSLAERKSH